MLEIYFVNESTVLDEKTAYNIQWACDYQLRFQFGRSGWRSDVRCSYVPSAAAARIPPGSAILHLLDTSDDPGALGYHDEDGNEVPFARVFVKTTQQYGEDPAETASHEVLELAADPNINLTAPTGDFSRLYAVEVGDPVQGTGYDVGEPYGRQVGVRVANFALPAYFDPNASGRPVDYRNVLNAPFTIAPQGYMSYVDLRNPGSGWQQEVGSERTTPPPPDHDDRLGRRIAKATNHPEGAQAS